MDKLFSITYKYRWFGPCEYGNGMKEETTIACDGSITAKRWENNGTTDKWRIVERASGTASPENVECLYKKLNELIYNRKCVEELIDDTEKILIIEEPGLKMEVDANLTDGKNYGSLFIEEFIGEVQLNWKHVNHRTGFRT